MAAPIVGKLGQAKPAATADATLYTCPASRRAVISTLSVAETGAAGATFRICANTATTTTEATAIVWDASLGANARYGFTEGWALSAGDRIIVQASTKDVTFTLFGEETDVPA